MHLGGFEFVCLILFFIWLASRGAEGVDKFFAGLETIVLFGGSFAVVVFATMFFCYYYGWGGFYTPFIIGPTIFFGILLLVKIIRGINNE